jgi:ribosomal protein S25
LALTVSIVCDKFKVNGAVARWVLRDLHSKGLIKQCGDSHSSFTLYAGTQAKAPGAAAEPTKKEK